MSKKKRLGSDPLSWIGDSRPEKMPKVNQIPLPEPEIEITIPVAVEKPAEKQPEITVVSKVIVLREEIETPPILVDPATKFPLTDESPEEAAESTVVVMGKIINESEKSFGTIKIPVREPENSLVQPEPAEVTMNQAAEIEEKPITMMAAQILPLESEPQPESAPVRNEPERSWQEEATPVVANVAEALTQALETREGKYLTFYLADEEYAIEIIKVQEIIGILPITPVPNTAHFIRGVINLRGQVIPVMELRIKFGMEEVEYTQQSCIIVVRSRGNRIGIIVDRVREVTNFKKEDIDNTPSFGNSVIDTEYILGVGKSGGNIKLLLDIDKVLQFSQA